MKWYICSSGYLSGSDLLVQLKWNQSWPTTGSPPSQCLMEPTTSKSLSSLGLSLEAKYHHSHSVEQLFFPRAVHKMASFLPFIQILGDSCLDRKHGEQYNPQA